ncbi:amine oxidase [Fictibacillus macauensis ZFHKF-1]|uniref:Amine oxidase n=1 Tax=Fictibacillus macauensis ZFHKF-1 TaxID=1196324 RepID=I8UB08_9BACL|nr:flavin monoamine oxidase family protein [Fictibacillus macauensis]EIT83953.1 amine oxidase [Fictibacillus macauensis ZFHKF-1]
MQAEALTEVEMAHILRYGMPKATSPRRVIIAGGGMSGLAACLLLKEAGHDVVLLEASHRIGGRVLTISEPFSEGHYFEAGAMRIPETHSLVLSLVERFGLKLEPFYTSRPEDLYYINGRRMNAAAYEQDPDALDFPVAPQEKGFTADQLMHYATEPLVHFIDEDPEKHWPLVIKRLGGYSVDRFLKENPYGRSLSPGAVDMIKVMLSLEGFPELSFLEIFRDILVLFKRDLKFFQIVGGNDQLPKRLAKEVTAEICFGQRVSRITQNEEGVRLNTKHPQTGTTYEVQGDCALITIPFSVLNFVRFEPYDSLSYLKRRAIRELHYAPATKIAVEFRSRFWEQEGLFGGKAVSDLPIRFAHYPSYRVQGSSGGVVVTSYTWEDDSNIWSLLPNDVRITESLRCFALIHGNTVYDELVTGSSYSWGRNPFNGGGFTMFKPYQEEEFGHAIGTREGHLYFAGEHASDHHGWMQGALKSAVKAAVAIQYYQ